MTSLNILTEPGGAAVKPAGELIKETTSVCPSCLKRLPATVLRVDNTVVMRKRCPDHGSFEALLAADAALYWEPVGDAVCGTGCCSTGHSCTLIFEVTERCNLSCPTCFTDSSPKRERRMSLEQFGTQLDALLGKGKGTADIVQLSGGEPTTHPDIEAMIALCFERGVERVYLNTTGVRLGKDAGFAERLGELNGKSGDRLQLYLQFDGFRPSTHQLLRGVDSLGEVKQRALANALANDIYVLPVMTVTRGVNLDEIGPLLKMALEHHPKTNCVMLQPAFYGGRYDNERPQKRMTAAELAHEVAAQSGGMFDVSDFGPLPCGHPNCFAMAVGFVRDGEMIPVSRYFPRIDTWDQPDVSARISRFADRMPQTLLETLGEDEVVDTLLDMLASGGDDEVDWSNHRSFFMVGIKPFMDAHNYDQDRVDKCCVHVVDPEGNPRSLCEYNTLYRDQP
jgi:uncharacterized radical SAM superfamily Fe-S cluster-containing enzyme